MSGYPERKHSAVLRAHLALEGARVLDIGCGDGGLVRFMARQGAAVTGLEISERAFGRLRAAEAKAAARGGNGIGSAETRGSYLCARGEALPIASGSLDYVTYFNSLHHVPVADQSASLEEAARALKPGGALVVVEPLAEGPGQALMAPVEDETEVRAAAYAAIGRAAASPAFEAGAEETYNAPYKVESFEAWKTDIVEVDPRRKLAVEAQGPEWVRAFEAAAEPVEGGYRLPNPSRLNILRRV